MKKVLAVSGGIDSVVMLHLFRNDPAIIVAHYNHGIRPNSDEDRDFVAKLAQRYGVKFETIDGNLGANASEARARAARYKFFESLCEKYHGKLYVAHHLDDAYESIAINILRGTGWRGLAPLGNPNIERPLLGWRKRDIYHYAAKYNLSFRQDQTNNENTYLRNRIRMALACADEAQKKQLGQLYNRQCQIATEIQGILDDFSSRQGQFVSRNLFRTLDERISIELLRELLRSKGISQTRPQLHRALAAIGTYGPGKRFPLGKEAHISIEKYHFIIKK